MWALKTEVRTIRIAIAAVIVTALLSLAPLFGVKPAPATEPVGVHPASEQVATAQRPGGPVANSTWST